MKTLFVSLFRAARGMRRRSWRAAFACAVLSLFLHPGLGFGALGDCGQPKSSGADPSASDALEVLRTAVGQGDCGGFDPCVCDVDGSGKVLASDALRVLKRAVGQPQSLDCVCPVTTTTTTSTTTTTLREVLTTELLVLTRQTGSYSTANLAGSWSGVSLATGPGAPWWGRLALTIQGNGNFAGTLTGSDAFVEDIEGRLSVSGSGAVTCTQNCSSDFLGSLDSGQSVIVVTETLDDDTVEMLVVTRKADSYGQSDLEGTWAAGGLESGPGAPLWTRGLYQVDAGGAFDAEIEDAYGVETTPSGTFTLSGSGDVSCSGCGSDFGGTLDAGKTVAVASQTQAGDGSSDLLVFAQRGPSYAQSDLTGTWFVSSVITGQDEPLWTRGTLTVSPGGAATGTLAQSDGGSLPVDGTMSIAEDGIVSFSADPALRCAMDADKTVMVCTTTW